MIAAAQTTIDGNPAQADAGPALGAESGPLISFPPTMGFRFGGETQRFTLTMPWSVQFGPLLRGGAGEGLRPFRTVVEPGLALPASGGSTVYFLRMGLRSFAYTKGIWGFGLGWGYTHSLSKKLAHALSEEVLISLGRCCSPGALILSVRYEDPFGGPGEIWMSVGFPLW